MEKIKMTPCGIRDLYVTEPPVFGDERGCFMETYNQDDFKEAGLDMVFVQDNRSISVKGVLHDLYFQKQYLQDKSVRVVRGRVFDVAVDLRSGSRTYGKWFGVGLTVESKRQFYTPEGPAHGSLVLSSETEFCYRRTDFYRSGDEGDMAWGDAEAGIEWLIEDGMKLIINEKDWKWQGFKGAFKS